MKELSLKSSDDDIKKVIDFYNYKYNENYKYNIIKYIFYIDSNRISFCTEGGTFSFNFSIKEINSFLRIKKLKKLL